MLARQLLRMSRARLLPLVSFAFAVGSLIQGPANAAEVSAETIKQALDAARYRAAVVQLTSPELGGRAVGTPGGEAAIRYVESEFGAIGLLPGYRGAFRQSYEHSFNGTARAANVIGVIEGSDPELKREVIVVSAHRDGLGQSRHAGCPNDSEGACMMPGANDNASGTAALFELARAFGEVRSTLRRTIAFLSTDAEECGCTGAVNYVYNEPAFPLAETVYNLNLDEIGEGGFLKTHPLNVSIPEGEECAVDAEVFASRGVPSQSLVGDSSQYHQCTDTVDYMDSGAALETVRKAVDLIWEATQAPPD